MIISTIRALAVAGVLLAVSVNAAYSADNDGRGQGNPGHAGKPGESKSGGTKSGSNGNSSGNGQTN